MSMRTERRRWPWLALCLAFAGALWAQTPVPSLELHDADDGALLLRDVQVQVLADALEVSGRVYRTRLTRLVAGRRIVASLRAADGTVRIARSTAVDVARLPRHGLSLARFSLRLPHVAQAGDTLVVALPHPDAVP